MPDDERGGVLVAFRGVSHRYRAWRGAGRVRALEQLTLELRPGEVFGIVGPNGAGKSTLLSLLLGFMRPTAGTVRIAGLEPRAYVERHGIAYVPELVTIPPGWELRETLARLATLAGVPRSLIGERVGQAIRSLGIGEHAGKKVRQLSKGNAQRLAIAQALLRDERVVVLDEPTHGLDPVWTLRFRDIVAGLRRADRVVVIASHDLDELQRVADRVGIIVGGRLARLVVIAEMTARGSSLEEAFRDVVNVEAW